MAEEAVKPKAKCCTSPEGVVSPPAPPPPENPIEYGVTEICDEFGLIAAGVNPDPGEAWLY
jgi:hypothetical protein